MARNLTDIHAQLGDAYIAQPEVQEKYALTPADVAKGFLGLFSKVAIERLFYYAVAFGIWTLEKIFDTHTDEVAADLRDKTPHSRRWYESKAKAFQYGFELLEYSDQFNNENKTDEEIATSKIVKYAAVREAQNYIVMKVAKVTGADLDALSAAELAAFKEYMHRAKDLGVYVHYLTDAAEQLRLEIDLYYNPLVLKSDGSRVDGTAAKPVADAVRAYLSNIDFDGTIVLASLTDELQKVPGVVIPHIKLAQFRYGALAWEKFDVLRQPLSGYARITDDNLIINYVPRTAQ